MTKATLETKTTSETQQSFFQIYDRIIKRIVTLSPNAVINLINGLFHTEYPPDSDITYNWTEHHDDELKRTIADSILTINREHAYHVEAQMYEDEKIEFRVFDYGYKHALTTHGNTDVLNFPEPQIIYLYSDKSLPKEKVIHLKFSGQGSFDYHVPVYNLMEHSMEELEEQKMIVLIPFFLLKLRKQLKKSRSIKDVKDLKSLIFDDILGIIKKNVVMGNITAKDANQLWSMVVVLYKYLYSQYEELKKEGLSAMMEQGLVLEFDLIEAEMEKEITKRVEKKVAASVTDEMKARIEKEVREKETENITKKVQKEIREEVTERIRAEEIEKVRAETLEKVRAEALEEVRAEVLEEVRAEVLEEVRAEALEEVRAEEIEKVRAEALEKVRAEVMKEVRAEMMEKMRADIIDAIREEVRAEMRDNA